MRKSNTVYRIVIRTPDGSEPDRHWKPAGWDEEAARKNPHYAQWREGDGYGASVVTDPQDGRPLFNFSPRRRFLSRAAAHSRAYRLSRLGLVVTIERGEVAWQTEDTYEAQVPT